METFEGGKYIFYENVIIVIDKKKDENTVILSFFSRRTRVLKSEILLLFIDLPLPSVKYIVQDGNILR